MSATDVRGKIYRCDGECGAEVVMADVRHGVTYQTSIHPGRRGEPRTVAFRQTRVTCSDAGPASWVLVDGVRDYCPTCARSVEHDDDCCCRQCRRRLTHRPAPRGEGGK